MRDLLNIIQLTESIDVHPAVREIKDGQVYINYPPNGVHRIEKECDYCCGDNPSWTEPAPCPYCGGSKIERETIYDFPNMNVSNRNFGVLCDLMGITNDEYHVYIPNKLIPNIRRRLIKIKNGDISAFEIPTQDEKPQARMDKSGDIPRITRGPQIIHFGVDETQLNNYIDRLLEIMDYAQKHGYDVSGA